MGAFFTSFIIAGWYGSNIGVLLLNKYLLSIYGFRFPVFLTFCHMLACSALSYALAVSNTVNVQPIKSRKQFTKIASLALIFCITVVLGNVSLKFIPVSFNQALGATTPAFTAVLAAVMLGHRETRQVYMSLIPVVVGIVIASGAEPMFNIIGFAAALTATAGRALKSVLQGIMLSDNSEKMDSMSLLMYMAPVAGAALVPVTIIFEPLALSEAFRLGQHGGFWLLLLFNSLLAYFVNLTNFLVTKHTSALTLQVLGNAKGVVAVVMSVLCFKNPVTFYSIMGYMITVCGVVLYSHAKKQSKRQEALIKLGRRTLNSDSPYSSPDKNLPGDLSLAERGGLLPKNGDMLVNGTAGHHGRHDSLGRGIDLGASNSGRLMARGFSSIFEA